MSARLLRRVLQELEEEDRRSIDSEPHAANDDDAPEASDLSSTFRNPFDILEDQEVELAETSVSEAIEQESSADWSSSNIVASRKPKKKKRKGKDNLAATNDKAVKAETSIDKVLESLSLDSRKQSSIGKTRSLSNTAVQTNLSSSILKVDPKFLRAENELRRIFGSKVVSSFENNGSRSRQMVGGRRGTHGHRKTLLISPSGYWPRWDGSFSMELLETKGGQNYFRYVHNSSYTQAQREFDTAKAMNDINGIANILMFYPYHIESLLTIAEILKFSGEYQSCADYIAKCLYALECAWHPLFNPLQGSCQLKYSHDTNKPLFSALFTHMQSMDRRGCHRSALEICKLLLSLDSDDPTGALFCVDYFALRAEEYAWLERFAEEYGSDNSLWLFPNYSYSLAISRFYLEKAGPSQDDKVSSKDLLKQALMLHPLVLKKLVAKVPLKEAIWATFLRHSFFGSAKAGSSTLDHLINIYVERNYLLWRYPDVQSLLKETAQQVIDSVNLNKAEAKDLDCVRKEAFSSEKNEYSHLLVSDFSDSVPALPPEELRNMMLNPQIAEAMHDPHRAQAVQNGDEVLIREEEDGPLPDLRNRNPLAIFLEGLLIPLAQMRTNNPSNDANDPREENQDDIAADADAIHRDDNDS